MLMKLTGIALAFVLAGCSSTPTRTDLAIDQAKANAVKMGAAQKAAEKALDNIPDWVINPPKSDALGVYGVGIGQSKKLDVSMKKGSLNAQYELAKSFGQVLSGNERNYTKDSSLGSTDDFTQLIDSIVAKVPVNGYEVVENEVVAMNGEYTNYTLLHLTYEQFGKGLSAAKQDSTTKKIKEEFNDLYERLEAIK